LASGTPPDVGLHPVPWRRDIEIEDLVSRSSHTGFKVGLQKIR